MILAIETSSTIVIVWSNKPYSQYDKCKFVCVCLYVTRNFRCLTIWGYQFTQGSKIHVV